MVANQSDDSSTGEPLSPKEITTRFDELEPGDRFSVNNRELSYKVVDTDTYSIIAEDSSGHQVTISQNLQSGGWSINEDVFHVETDSSKST